MLPVVLGSGTATFLRSTELLAGAVWSLHAEGLIRLPLKMTKNRNHWARGRSRSKILTVKESSIDQLQGARLSAQHLVSIALDCPQPEQDT